MVSPTGYGSNIKGSNSDIGYNKSNGYVTINGQDFLNSFKVLDGDRSVFPLPGPTTWLYC